MIFFEWPETYLTNISKFDTQHQKLVSLINALYVDLVSCQNISQKQPVIVEALLELIAYSFYHFEAEEELMILYEYPGYMGHKEEHDQFKQQVSQFVKEQSEGTLILSFPILVFLKDWLTSHVLTTDMQYGPYLNERM
ncbi:MAG: hemerythrin-like metal-binding protein [Firmicutes bacterium]|nr:hemerythrin-like metal-binding protein [Bacillota bacterium]